jgi:hypothetical protein
MSPRALGPPADPTEEPMHPDGTPDSDGTPSWLFRGTESAWDMLMATLTADPSRPTPWPIAPSGPSMAPGDRVLLWRSGQGGGIAATCTVLDEPVATLGSDERPTVTVDIGVDRAFGRPIAPAELLEHPELRPLAFMDLFATTEHRISAPQAAALTELIARRDQLDVVNGDGTTGEVSATTQVAVPDALVAIVRELLVHLGASDPSVPSSPPTDLQVAQAEAASRSHGTEPFTVDEVAATWHTGVGTARSRIERLMESGLVERAGTRSPSESDSTRPARGRPPVLYRLRSPDLLER